jgi:hypothetical protein
VFGSPEKTPEGHPALLGDWSEMNVTDRDVFSVDVSESGIRYQMNSEYFLGTLRKIAAERFLYPVNTLGF